MPVAEALTRYAPNGAVAAANHLAASAGAALLARGAGAVDAAIAAAAVMAVTSPHMCGLGGDLFALVLEAGRAPAALNASGRAGSGADPERLRARGLKRMPYREDVASVTVPGCVDGLVALHERFATLELDQLLAPAVRLARSGFPISPTLALESAALPAELRSRVFGGRAPLRAGQRLALPALANVLGAIAASGRAGFYEGAPGQALLALGGGLFSAADLKRHQADWVKPLSLEALGRTLWTVPPNSQGYLALASAWIAEHAGIPAKPGAGAWAGVLVEAALQAARDRLEVLHEHADGASLLAEGRLVPRAAAARDGATESHAGVWQEGDTTYLCAVDERRTAVSLIFSNGAGFGSHLALAEHQVFLHNRGIGFSLASGHPAEYGPGRRPPHTLSPLAVTTRGGEFEAVLGTMGADAQPQILLQLLARTLGAGESPGAALAAPRWVLSRPGSSSFHVWEPGEPPRVRLEEGAPATWSAELRRRGWEVELAAYGEHGFGHAQMIRTSADGMLCGAADPRSRDGALVGC